MTVYCGSSTGRNPHFVDAARAVGRAIADSGATLVYGGGHMGLMGAVGRATTENGGRSIAVIPQFMIDRGWNDPHASETVVTSSMHERKATMAAMARGVIALPGGIGTWEELCETITWRQLELFNGNIVVLNLEGYYDSWLAQFDAAIAEGFLPASHRALFAVTEDPAEAVKLALKEPERFIPEPKSPRHA